MPIIHGSAGRRSILRSLPLAALLLFAAQPVLAQLVRGTVKGPDGAPLSGAVVTLFGPGGTVASRAVVRANGAYELRAPAEGSWQLLLSRTGFESQPQPPVKSSGLVTQHPIVAELVPLRLASLVGSGLDDCRIGIDLGEAERELWTTVRSDLTALVLAESSRLVLRELRRFERTFDVDRRKLFEERTLQPVKVNERPFVTPAPDSLARAGYVRGDSTYFTFDMPDARLVLSEEFAARHCFRIQPQARQVEGRTQVGLAFAPVGKPTVTEVEGTFWLDVAQGRLASMEFRYTPQPAQKGTYGGEQIFGQTADGFWYVARWTQQVPLYAARTSNQNRAMLTPDGQLRQAFVRELSVTALREDGGDAVPVKP